MADVASLVLGVAALWQTCVQIFDVVESGRRYGMNYELLRVKLEVERIRLFNWGEAIGLSDIVNRSNIGTAGPSRVSAALRPDVQLRKEDVNSTVMRLLGYIQHLFENSEQMQNTYGLRPVTPRVEAQNTTTIASSSNEFVLGAVFKKSYESLKRNARDRQRNTTMVRRTLWAIHDKKKFQAMVVEIRGFNDSLESLFPGSRNKIAEVIRVDLEASENIDELQLLQDATIDDHAEISDVASARLEELGALSTARTELLSERIDAFALNDWEEEDEEDVEDIEREGEDNNTTATAVDPALTEAQKRVNEVEHLFKKKRAGALSLHVTGPDKYSARVTTHCYWGDQAPSHWWQDREMGYMATTHAAFGAYHKRRYMRKRDDDKFDFNSEEGAVLFDVESNPKYENLNPGTVTVEGFGLEAWNFEETHSQREQTVFVNYSDPGNIPARKLLRRIDELQHGPGKLGWNPERDHADLKEFTGDMGITYAHPSYEYEDRTQFSNLFSLLNRTDIFVNFLSTSSVFAESNDSRGNGRGFWNLLWQVIIAKELVRRFETNPKDSYTSGFTGRVLASMIVADLWIKNVEIVLTEMKIPPKDIKPPETEDLKAKAEDFKKRGNDALAKKEYEKAIEFYTEAIKIDPSSAVYRANRSAASYSLERYEDSLEDAYIAIRLDVKYAKAWSRYGLAGMKLGWTKKAVEAYENAIVLAGKDATASMRQGLTDAKAANAAKLKAIENELDKKKQDVLRKNFIDQDFEIMLKSVEVHSRCHEQQVEGLILFAERMKWPWINDVRDYAEEVYSSLRSGQVTPIHLQDWLFGMTLPGQWFSFKIMTALIMCTPPISGTIPGIAPYYDCGLSLSKKSYWRVRTVLGRVLGCLPSVTSLCGWLGPCPPVEFLKTGPDDFDSSKPWHIKLKARSVTLVEHKGWSDDATIFIGGSSDRYEDTRLRDNEEIEPWMAEMKNQSNWIVPEPPVRQVSTCDLAKIQLKRDLSAKDASTDPDAKAVYRAQLTFTIDDNPTEPITYKLHTNPVFVTPPPCHPGPRGPSHEVHHRELHRYQERNIWTIERLKKHTVEDDPEHGGVMVINATGQGAETLARAWCSERGKNAVIRRAGGPCFVCAERAASQCGLGTRVLIWVS